MTNRNEEVVDVGWEMFKQERWTSGQRLALSLVSGVLLGLAFPPLRLGFLAYVGLVPLLLTIDGEGRRRAFQAGFLSGVAFNLVTLYWISWITTAGMIASVFILSLFFGLFVMLMDILVGSFGKRMLFASPFLWTAIEYLRSFGDLGFPWTALGNTQTYYTSLIQFASVTSVYGVSFWIVTVNVLLLQLLRDFRDRRSAVILTGTILVLFLLPYLYGIGEIPEEELKGELKVALIQPNIGPEEKWGRGGTRFSFDTLSRMTVKASYEKPDLVIWPETAAPCYIRLKPKYRRIVHSLSDSLGTPILTGAPDYVPETGESYNSAFLFTPGERKLQGYSKINLVPVSERVPYRDVLPLLGKIKWDMLEDTDWGQANFSRGKEFSIFQHPKGRFATLICFESIFPDLVREFVRREADFLVNITNDAWFGRTSSPYQHARIAVFRAVENRIAIARCASTGVSMFIDPYGRVSQATGIFHPAIVLGSIPLRKEDTFFTKYGNVFSNGTVAVSLGLILMAVVSGLRRKVEN